MKNSAFIDVLTTIHDEGINTKETLMANQQLYDNFGLATHNFVRSRLLSKHHAKVNNLQVRGITTLDDITMDCLERIVKYLDNMLKKPTVSYMKNYTGSVVDTLLDTIYRRLPPVQIIPLDAPINGTDAAADTSRTLSETIPDVKYEPERMCIEQETIQELTQVLQEKRAKEQSEKKALILREISRLNKRPAEVMVRLACTHLSMKPRQLAALIVDKGCEAAYADIILMLSDRYAISIPEIRNSIAGHRLTEQSVMADTNSPKAVAEQVSRLIYRADKHLK